MPKREVTSAPWVPVPARACTGKAPRARQHRAVGRLSAGAPRLHKSCRLRRPQSKGRSCRSGRARRDPRARGGRRHLSERPGWPSGAPISRGSTVSMIAFGGRQGPHRSGSRCRGRPIERREAGRELNNLKSVPSSWLKWFPETAWSCPRHWLNMLQLRVFNTKKIGPCCTRSVRKHTR